jgi:hypothetical protein
LFSKWKKCMYKYGSSSESIHPSIRPYHIVSRWPYLQRLLEICRLHRHDRFLRFPAPFTIGWEQTVNLDIISSMNTILEDLQCNRNPRRKPTQSKRIALSRTRGTVVDPRRPIMSPFLAAVWFVILTGPNLHLDTEPISNIVSSRVSVLAWMVYSWCSRRWPVQAWGRGDHHNRQPSGRLQPGVCNRMPCHCMRLVLLSMPEGEVAPGFAEK